MKKLRDTIEHYVLEMENHWKVLPVAKQRFLTKVFFGGYVFLTVIAIINIFISTGQKNNAMSTNHIEGISKESIEKGSGRDNTVNSTTKE
ncbi:hypothetical protein ACP3T3_01180 [Chryseobacterium sp. CBSDS_008]|uniref:hypothetical protein n=1 Tax=Chryseobacterium sp. CBSDS_008 TaxID=3415265 RepID=UPI003CF3431A